jgi:hypothetical protein
MGASYVSKVLPWSDQKALKSATDEISSESAFQHGRRYSGQWNMCNGLTVLDVKPFATVSQAEDYLHPLTERGGPLMAVPAFQENAVPDKIRSENTEDAQLRQEVLANDIKTWGHDSWVVAQAKAGPDAFKVCTGCESKISVKHLMQPNCPVCKANLLRTPETNERKQQLREKGASLLRQLADHKRLMWKTAFPEEPYEKKVWVVAGLCSE